MKTMAKAAHEALLTDQDRQRYQRQMMMAGWGEEGQEKLKAAHVFVAGAGGLGSPASIYLAVAGVGRITICDFDSPDLSNLNRQILHNDARIGVNKAVSAEMTLRALNPSIEVAATTTRIEAENVDELVGEAQLIMDCMDNFPTRYLLNACALRKGIPFVHGSVWGLEGKLTFIQAPETACLQCIFPAAPPRALFPVLGATPGVIGCLQAMEAVKYLTGVGETLKGRMLIWDGVDQEFLTCPTRRDPQCPVCGRGQGPGAGGQ
jgi:molybdopterin/thiamine biosynthesis adenylyltransferase